MTNLFGQMPAGQVFGAGFFFLLILAAITSAGAVQEVLTSSLTDLLPIKRRTATWVFTVLLAGLSTPIVLSQGPWSGLQVYGMDLFTFADMVTGRFMLAAGSWVLSLYVVFAWGFDDFQLETNIGAGRIRVSAAWKPLMIFVIPVAVAMVLFFGLGII